MAVTRRGDPQKLAIKVSSHGSPIKVWILWRHPTSCCFGGNVWSGASHPERLQTPPGELFLAARPTLECVYYLVSRRYSMGK
ncbi:hypothetical protein V8C40DRAFT_237359 [Trichoderma camerunense]